MKGASETMGKVVEILENETRVPSSNTSRSKRKEGVPASEAPASHWGALRPFIQQRIALYTMTSILLILGVWNLWTMYLVSSKMEQLGPDFVISQRSLVKSWLENEESLPGIPFAKSKFMNLHFNDSKLETPSLNYTYATRHRIQTRLQKSLVKSTQLKDKILKKFKILNQLEHLSLETMYENWLLDQIQKKE